MRLTDWYDDEQATFGDRLTASREAAGLTECDLARKLGIAVKTIRAWEEDKSAPRASRLQTLAGLLNVSLMWLLNGSGVGLAEPQDCPAPAPEDLKAAITDLRKIRAEMDRISNRAAVLERRLQRLSQGQAA
jgi:transcriptional regulator with XRE-family HTH domain